MDLNAIKGKLAGLNGNKGSKNEKKEKIDWALYLWKPKTEGKHQIRFVPSPNEFKENEVNPFKEVFLHYGLGKFPLYALTNWGEKDPIVEASKELKKGEYDVENWRLSGKLEPKMRVFAPIIVRGEEDKGVRLWEFGKEIYSQLLNIAEDEDYGDFTDVNDGRDFTVTATPDKLGNGTSYLKATIQVKPKSTPLSKDAKEVEKWLTEQPDILELQSRYKKTFDQLKEILIKYITPSEDTEEPTTSEETEDNEVDNKVEEIKGKPLTKAKSNPKKFDELFTNTK